MNSVNLLDKIEIGLNKKGCSKILEQPFELIKYMNIEPKARYLLSRFVSAKSFHNLHLCVIMYSFKVYIMLKQAKQNDT